MPNDLDVLRGVTIFRDLDDSELAAMWEMMTVREVPPKTRIVEEGKPVHELCIVTDGVVHVRRMAGSREMLLTRLGPGAFFGEINLFDCGTATASVFAMKATQIAALPYEPLRAYFEANPVTGYKVVTALMREVSRRLRQTNSRLSSSAYWKPGPAVES